MAGQSHLGRASVWRDKGEGASTVLVNLSSSPTTTVLVAPTRLTVRLSEKGSFACAMFENSSSNNNNNNLTKSEKGESRLDDQS